MDRGLTFKEANEKMKTEWIELEVSPSEFEPPEELEIFKHGSYGSYGLTEYKRKSAVDPTCVFPVELEFVEGEVESGKKYYEENVKEIKYEVNGEEVTQYVIERK